MKRYIEGTVWPTSYDYEDALETLDEHMLDPELRNGQVERNPKTQMLIARNRPGTHICLYRINTNCAVRFFCQPESGDRIAYDDILLRYRILQEFIAKHFVSVSALLPLQYVADGINVDIFKRDLMLGEKLTFIRTRTMPLVKMPFIAGSALNNFISQHRREKAVLHQLSEAWRRMIIEMEAVGMAHGDLDVTNVLVVEDRTRQTLFLKLIDYDNTWIPEFARYAFALPEQGHEFFQHPAFFRRAREFNASIDRFPALVIYVSLLVLAEFPELYEQWGLNDNRLIFSLKDYQDEQRGSSDVFRYLRTLNISGLDPYLAELSRCLLETCVPLSLSEIAKKYLPPPPPPIIHVNTGEMLIDWSSFEPDPQPGVPQPPLERPFPLNSVPAQPTAMPSPPTAPTQPVYPPSASAQPVSPPAPPALRAFQLAEYTEPPPVPISLRAPLDPRAAREAGIRYSAPPQHISPAPRQEGPLPAAQADAPGEAERDPASLAFDARLAPRRETPAPAAQADALTEPDTRFTPLARAAHQAPEPVFFSPLGQPPSQRANVAQPGQKPAEPVWQNGPLIFDHRQPANETRSGAESDAANRRAAEQGSHQPLRFDRSTWLGCIIVLVIAALILTILVLILRSALAAHGSILPPIHLASVLRGLYVRS
ncbi:MAG TPA: hypothetical protein VGD98_10205 [Ktedonobacteraceae bacterium]